MADTPALEAGAERRAGSSPAWGTIRISLSMFRRGQQAMRVGSMRQFVSPDRQMRSPDRRFGEAVIALNLGKTVIQLYRSPFWKNGDQIVHRAWS